MNSRAPLAGAAAARAPFLVVALLLAPLFLAAISPVASAQEEVIVNATVNPLTPNDGDLVVVEVEMTNPNQTTAQSPVNLVLSHGTTEVARVDSLSLAANSTSYQNVTFTAHVDSDLDNERGLIIQVVLPNNQLLGEHWIVGYRVNVTRPTFNLTSFSDGSPSKTLLFASCLLTDSSSGFLVPFNATVVSASLDVTLALNSTSTSGSFSADVGSNGGDDGAATLSLLTTSRLVLDASAFNAYLQARAATSGAVNIPVTFAACGNLQALLVVLDNVTITYSLLTMVNTAPVLAGSIGEMSVVAGGANLSAVDLAPFFEDLDGDRLTFGARVVASAEADASGLTVNVSGSHVDLRVSNASWWGEVQVEFFAHDLFNATAISNLVTVHIQPAPATNETSGSQLLTDLFAFSTGLCGPPDYRRTFRIPEDATITTAFIELVTASNFTASSALVSISPGAESSVRITSNGAPTTVWLNASAINAQLNTAAAPWGIAELNLSVSVCPTGGWAAGTGSVRITYARPFNGSGSGGPALPAIIGIAFDGELTTTVEGGAPLTLEVRVNETLGAQVQVSWYIDGAFAGNGQTVSGITLAPGDHVVEVRVTDGVVTHSYTSHITAGSKLSPAGAPFSVLFAAGIAIGLCAVGLAAAGTERGRWLVLGVLVGSVFSRLKKASLLDHFVRGTLYQVIRENPGIHFAELRRRAQIGNGAASYHLRVLEQGAYVRVVVDGMKTRFYTTDRKLEEEVYGISDTDRAVLEAVVGTPGIGEGELVAKVNRSQSVVSRSISRLVALGFVTATHEAGRVQVFPRPGVENAAHLTTSWPDERA